MAINLYIRLSNEAELRNNNQQHYKEIYRFQATGDEANEPVNHYRLRHFLTATTQNSAVKANSGLCVYDGNSMTPLTGSYNDWTTPNRPPKFDKGAGQFNTEMIVRFDVGDDRKVGNLPNNAQAWITMPYGNDNGVFSFDAISNSFSFLGGSNTDEFIKNPMNIALEHKVGGGPVSRIYTVNDDNLPINATSTCADNSNLYKVQTVVVETREPHNLSVGNAVTLYSRSVSHVPSYMGNEGRLFGKSPGERYLGDFVVTDVTSPYIFKYQTHHNPAYINKSNHPEYTSSDWNDLVWERWVLYEYSDSVSASASGSSVVFTFTGADPSEITCKHNFVEDDLVTFTYNTSSHVRMVVTAVGNNTVTAIPVSGETFPSGVTSGRLDYTPRMPSSDIAFNVIHPEIAPQKAKSHSNENRLIYACQDTYYDAGGMNRANGNDSEMQLVRDVRIPILKFPIPSYDGSAESDENLVSKLFIYAGEKDGAITDNTIELYGFNTDYWDESDTSSALATKHGSNVWNGTRIDNNAYTNPTRFLTNRYISFDIDNPYTVSMLTGRVSKSIFLNSQKASSLPNYINFGSREDRDDGHWPYITISSMKFIGKKPSIDIYNTYMYLVCDRIKKEGSVFSATVSPNVFDSSSLMYVRSWDADKPFFDVGDEIEIMNTEHYDTGKIVAIPNEGKKRVTATVVHVEYSEHKVYFLYNNWNPGDPPPECGIIRNRTRMISTYVAEDADNNTDNLSVNGPDPNSVRKYGYDDDSIQFDVIHNEAVENETSLNVVYNDGDNSSNELHPVILTDIEVITKDGSHARDDDRFVHVGPKNTLVLKGFNLDRLSQNAHAVLGHSAWEDGFKTGGIPVQLYEDNAHPDERCFDYKGDFNLQRSMHVYEVRNLNGATEFKVRKTDYPFFGTGDVIAALYTGEYVEAGNANVPDELSYGKNYYVVDAVDADDTYKWLTLSSTYMFKYEELTPTYVELDPNDVDDINGIIRNGGNPLMLYSTVTSVTLEDASIELDTNFYANRLYLQLDEEAPVCYVPEPADEHIAGRPFDVYLSDLNDIYTINGQLLENFTLGSVEYLLDEGDSRFIKITLTLDSSTTLEIFDAAGNFTSLEFEVISIDSDINIEITGISSNGTTHTLNFKVTDRDYTSLSTTTGNPGVSGIWATLGNNYLTPEHFKNISGISPIGERGYFTFDLVIKEEEIIQSNGYFEVWAGDTNEGDAHKTCKWGEPILFKKEFSCVETWDVLQCRGVNLYDELDFRGPNAPAFEIDDNDHNATSLPVKVVSMQTGPKNFGIKWKNASVSPALSKYMNTITVTTGPTIYFQQDSSQTVKVRKGNEWVEPSDVKAEDWAHQDISDRINIVYPTKQDWWNETGKYTIVYNVTDECGRMAEPIERTVIVTECDIPIITTKEVYNQYEDVGIMIDPSSTVLFNQNVMNNVVSYAFEKGGPYITATLLSGTPDRKLLYIKNPGVITSQIWIKVDVGQDNTSANGCFVTEPIDFRIESKEDQDKPLDVDGKASIVKKNSKRSRFDDLNFEPIYNKDLSYSSFTVTADENSLMQNVYSILLTNLGERLYDDEFGSTLEESVFEIIGDLNGESKLLNQCVTLINKYEPRAVVVEDKSYVAINEDNTVVIVLYIKVPRGIARKIELTFRKST